MQASHDNDRAALNRWRKTYGKTQNTAPPHGWKVYLRDGWSSGLENWRVRYRQYLKSSAWRLRRQGAIKRANGCCAMCQQPSKRLEVHHVDYVRAGNEQVEDVRVLCRNCHSVIHTMRAKPVIPLDDMTRAMVEARVYRERAKSLRTATMAAVAESPSDEARAKVRRRPRATA